MALAQTYSIFEDHVMLFTAPFTLGTNGSVVIAQPAAAGKTYRIAANQAPGIPAYVAPPVAHNTIVNCHPLPSGLRNTGSVGQFYSGNTTPWIHRDCQPNVSSFDPNDKAAQPLGYGNAHYINRLTPLDYRIRFQNTGTDTAFNIVVLDTLSRALDWTTLQMGSSSHPYTWNISNEGVIRVTFPNIRLVDSTTNEPLSHGFFTYEIQQQPNLPLGTVIENSAAIYFDYNAPIITNTTFHTIGENFATLLSVETLPNNQVEVQVYPNPFRDQTTIEVLGQNFETLRLEVVDVAGRVVQTQSVTNNNRLLLDRHHLVAGLYLYRLIGDEALISTGKLRVQ
jgi:hypothetical protein